VSNRILFLFAAAALVWPAAAQVKADPGPETTGVEMKIHPGDPTTIDVIIDGQLLRHSSSPAWVSPSRFSIRCARPPALM